MRKTTSFARKRARAGLSASPAALSITHFQRPGQALKASLPYSDPVNEADGHKLMASHRTQLQHLLDHTLSAGDTEAHDAMSHVIGMAQIRVMEMGGDGANDVMTRLNEAAYALQRTRERWEKTQAWGLDGPARSAMVDAMDIYEALMWASTPKQMQRAQNLRLERLAEIERKQKLKEAA